MLNMHENQCTKLGQQYKHKNDVSDVVLVILSTTSEVCVLRTQLSIYDGAFFAIQWAKAKIFNWVLNTSLKF